MKKITAIDALTVEFQLCNPDVAFLPKIAFSAFGIQDSDYLAEARAGRVDPGQKPNGTGPYKLKEWSKGNRMVWDANPDYWGDKAKTPEPRVPLERRVRRAAARPAVRHRRRHRQPGHARHRHDQGRLDPQVLPARRPEHVLPRLQQHVRSRGTTSGSARRSPWASTARRSSRTSTRPARRSPTTSRRARSRSAARATTSWEFDVAKAKQLLADAGFPDGQGLTPSIQFRAAVRGYDPNPPVIATEISQQLKKNLGINATLELQESGAFLDGIAAGTLEGISLLGWGADYPDPSNFLDYHFGAGSGKKFGDPFQDIVAALNKGVSTADPAAREAAYATANNLIKAARPGCHRRARRLRRRLQGRRRPAPTRRRSATRCSPDEGGRPDDARVRCRTPSRSACTAPTSPTARRLRACEQINESLYGYEIGGRLGAGAGDRMHGRTPTHDLDLHAA